MLKPLLIASCLALSASPLLARPDEANCQTARTAVPKPVSLNLRLGYGINFYSVQKEIELGNQLALEVEHSSKLIDDSQTIGFITCIGQTLAHHIPNRIPLTFKVIDSDVVEVLILPGGHIYLNTGLLLKAESESELAGVIAYCIAHVALRHGTRIATQSQIMQMATIPLILLGPGGWAGYGNSKNTNLTISMVYLKWLEDQRREADLYGMRYSYNAGYEPEAYVRFFQRTLAERAARATAQKVPGIFMRQEEQRAIEQEKTAKALPARDEDTISTSEFEIMKQRLREIDSLQKESDPTKPTLHKKQEAQSD